MTIHVNSVMNSLYTTLSSNSTLVNSNVSVDLNEPFNTDPNRTPWIGVYFGSVDIEPHRLSQYQPWMAGYQMLVFVQGSSFENGQSANDELDRTLTNVITAINSNRTLDNTINLIQAYSILPFQRDIEDEQWMFTNEITITAEVPA